VILHTPWKIQNEVHRLLTTPRTRLYFALNGVQWRSGLSAYGCPIIQRHRKSEIILGKNLELRSSQRSNPLSPAQPVVLSTRRAGSRIMIGDDCGMTGAVLVADQLIVIGDRVLVGANVVISDTDFHPLSPESRRHDISAGASKPVTIEDDVFIGMQALILKGVTLGRGSVIGAGSVVTKDVPAGSIVAGNPAKVVGRVP